MKKLILAVFFTTAVAVSTVKANENLPAPVIAVVEQATLDKSSALKSIISQVEKKRNEVQKEMVKYENELKAEDKKLADEQKKLSEQEFSKKRQKFEARVRDVQERLELRRAQIELGIEDAKKQVLQTFLKVSDQVRQEVGANLMLYKETVVTADNSFDVSNQVLDRLNKELPSVHVTYKPEAEVKKELLKQLQLQQG